MASIKKMEGKGGVSYKITVTSGTDAVGKQIRHFKTWRPDRPMTAKQMEKEVKRVAYEFERQIELGFQADDRQTFSEYAEYFLQLQERNGMAPGSILQRRGFMDRIGPVLGHMRLQAIRPQHINAFYRELEKPGAKNVRYLQATAREGLREHIAAKGLTQKAVADGINASTSTLTKACNGKSMSLKTAEKIAAFLGAKVTDLFTVDEQTAPLSVATILRYHSFIHSVLEQAVKEMVIPYNPASRATPPKDRDGKEPEYFQPDELASILEALESEPIKWRTLIHLMIVTGCRRGEIVGLKWDKIDFERKEIKVDRSLSYVPGVGAIDGPTKTKNTRYISIPDETISLLRKYRSWQAELQLGNGDRWQGEGYLFTQDDGRPMHPSSVNARLRKFSERHGLPYIHPHSFRHSAASILISEGVDIVTVSKILGHSKPSMTTDRYSHVIQETRRKAAESVAGVLLRKKQA